jgi:hypothetical protein
MMRLLYLPILNYQFLKIILDAGAVIFLKEWRRRLIVLFLEKSVLLTHPLALAWFPAREHARRIINTDRNGKRDKENHRGHRGKEKFSLCSPKEYPEKGYPLREII